MYEKISEHGHQYFSLSRMKGNIWICLYCSMSSTFCTLDYKNVLHTSEQDKLPGPQSVPYVHFMQHNSEW